jgi:hypothetical protein
VVFFAVAFLFPIDLRLGRNLARTFFEYYKATGIIPPTVLSNNTNTGQGQGQGGDGEGDRNRKTMKGNDTLCVEMVDIFAQNLVTKLYSCSRYVVINWSV